MIPETVESASFGAVGLCAVPGFVRFQEPVCLFVSVHPQGRGLAVTKRIFVHFRIGLTLALFSTCLGMNPGALQAQDEYCDTNCEEDCGGQRCSLGYSIARHLKLQSVYAFRKICRPYRRMAGTPEQLAPWVEPALPYNTDPFGASAPAGGGFGGGIGAGAPGAAPDIPTSYGGWAGNSGYDSFGSSYRYTPSGPAIRYNSAP